MKNFLIFIFLLFLIGNLSSQCTSVQVIQNGLNVSFNQITGQVIISGIDPCSYTSEELETLECYKKCEREAIEILNACHESSWWEDCKTDWENEGNSIGFYSSLDDECCPEAKTFEFTCKRDCGPEPEPSKTAISYLYAVQLWYTTGLVETFEGHPKERIVSDKINLQPPYLLVVNLENKLPEESLSFCYFTELLVQYDDGSCCYFQDFACFNKG